MDRLKAFIILFLMDFSSIISLTFRGISSFFNIEQFLDFIDEVETKFKIIKENLNNEAEKS